jgi:peptide/nickel transport system substrate-binding protein
VGAASINDANCQAANLAPIGTNAWKLKEFKPGDTAVYERNENYRDPASVYFDTVVIKGGGDATSAARAVCETGEVDYSWNLQVQKAVLEPILAGGKCDAVAGGSFGVERIHINFANPDPALGDKRSEPDQPHPFLSDLKVRQALAMAIDRQAIADQLYGPTGSPTCNIAAAPANIVSPNTTCERDLEGAKALLAEAGWADTNADGTVDKDGYEAKLLFQTSINPLRQGEQAIIKQNLEEIGIGVELKSVDAGVFFSGDAGNPDTINKFYADLQMYTNSPDSPDPTYYFGDYTCAEVASSANQWSQGNYSRYCDPEFDKLYEQFTGELDPAKRDELAIAMNDYLITNAVVIPLINRVTPSGKAKNLEGPTYNSFDGNIWNINTWKRAE